MFSFVFFFSIKLFSLERLYFHRVYFPQHLQHIPINSSCCLNPRVLRADRYCFVLVLTTSHDKTERMHSHFCIPSRSQKQNRTKHVQTLYNVCDRNIIIDCGRGYLGNYLNVTFVKHIIHFCCFLKHIYNVISALSFVFSV